MSKTFSFRVADCHGYATVGQFEDGRPAEVFLKVAKQGSTLAGIMDAFAISVSHGLQYGVPLQAFVDMFTNMRFEPAGMTDDPDIRFATSLVDYIFKRLAVEYLSCEKRCDWYVRRVGSDSSRRCPAWRRRRRSRRADDGPAPLDDQSTGGCARDARGLRHRRAAAMVDTRSRTRDLSCVTCAATSCSERARATRARRVAQRAAARSACRRSSRRRAGNRRSVSAGVAMKR